MATDDRITFLVLEAQQRIFRLAERDHGLSLKALSLDSGMPYNTIRSYAGGASVMPVPALLKLVGVIPDELLSQMLEPVRRHLAENDSDDGDHDTLASNCIEFVGKHSRARHPASPAGTDIAPCEDKDLRETRQQLRARA